MQLMHPDIRREHNGFSDGDGGGGRGTPSARGRIEAPYRDDGPGIHVDGNDRLEEDEDERGGGRRRDGDEERGVAGHG